MAELYSLQGLPGAAPETPAPKGELPPWTETTVVGRRTPRVDVYDRVSG